jgi:hypothetical protein
MHQSASKHAAAHVALSLMWLPYLRRLQLRLELLLLLLLVCLQLLQPCLCGTYLVASSIAQLAQALNLHGCGHAFTHKLWFGPLLGLCNNDSEELQHRPLATGSSSTHLHMCKSSSQPDYKPNDDALVDRPPT